MTTLIENAWIDGQGLVRILIRDGRIAEVGTQVEAPPGCGHLDAMGMAAVPGLVNGHTHAAMTLLRGYGDDMPLMEWLQTRIWPAEARMTEEDVYWGTKWACVEMIRSGTVCFQDMYWHYHAVARAVEEMGLKAGIGSIMIDVGGRSQAEHFMALAEKNLEETKQYSSRIRYTLSPHAIYTVSPESLTWIARFSERHEVPVHIHLSETLHEVEECLKQHGMRPAFHLDRLGLLNPRVFLAHGVHLDDVELDLIAQRGATLVTNPISNLKLAVGGIFPYTRAAQRGIPMALGTDGTASNNVLDLFQEMKTFALIQKHADGSPTTLPAHEAWAIATGARAPVFGQTGAVVPGAPADLLLLSHDEPEICPRHDFVSNLVYAATGHVVDSVIVEGRILMRGRSIPGEEEIRQQVKERAARICD